MLLYVTTSELNCCDDCYLSAGDKLCFVWRWWNIIVPSTLPQPDIKKHCVNVFVFSQKYSLMVLITVYCVIIGPWFIMLSSKWKSSSSQPEKSACRCDTQMLTNDENLITGKPIFRSGRCSPALIRMETGSSLPRSGRASSTALAFPQPGVKHKSSSGSWFLI